MSNPIHKIDTSTANKITKAFSNPKTSILYTEEKGWQVVSIKEAQPHLQNTADAICRLITQDDALGHSQQIKEAIDERVTQDSNRIGSWIGRVILWLTGKLKLTRDTQEKLQQLSDRLQKAIETNQQPRQQPSPPPSVPTQSDPLSPLPTPPTPLPSEKGPIPLNLEETSPSSLLGTSPLPPPPPPPLPSGVPTTPRVKPLGLQHYEKLNELTKGKPLLKGESSLPQLPDGISDFEALRRNLHLEKGNTQTDEKLQETQKSCQNYLKSLKNFLKQIDSTINTVKQDKALVKYQSLLKEKANLSTDVANAIDDVLSEKQGLSDARNIQETMKSNGLPVMEVGSWKFVDLDHELFQQLAPSLQVEQEAKAIRASYDELAKQHQLNLSNIAQPEPFKTQYLEIIRHLNPPINPKQLTEEHSRMEKEASWDDDEEDLAREVAPSYAPDFNLIAKLNTLSQQVAQLPENVSTQLADSTVISSSLPPSSENNHPTQPIDLGAALMQEMSKRRGPIAGDQDKSSTQDAKKAIKAQVSSENLKDFEANFKVFISYCNDLTAVETFEKQTGPSNLIANYQKTTRLLQQCAEQQKIFNKAGISIEKLYEHSTAYKLQLHENALKKAMETLKEKVAKLQRCAQELTVCLEMQHHGYLANGNSIKINELHGVIQQKEALVGHLDTVIKFLDRPPQLASHKTAASNKGHSNDGALSLLRQRYDNALIKNVQEVLKQSGSALANAANEQTVRNIRLQTENTSSTDLQELIENDTLPRQVLALVASCNFDPESHAEKVKQVINQLDL